jgi:hypothetical protein
MFSSNAYRDKHMKALIVVGLVVCASFVAASTWWLAERETSRKSTKVTLSEGETVLLAQVQDLASEVRTLKAQQGERFENSPRSLKEPQNLGVNSNTNPIPKVGEPKEINEIDPERQKIDELYQRNFENLNRAISSEPKDPAWAPKAQDVLFSAYQQKDFTGAKIQTTCKSTFCQVKFDLSETSNPALVSRQFQAQGPWPGPTMIKFDMRTNQGEYYIAREEFELPMIN